MSRQPRRARCQAMLLPTMPPPTMTTRAWAGSELMRGDPPGRSADRFVVTAGRAGREDRSALGPASKRADARCALRNRSARRPLRARAPGEQPGLAVTLWIRRG